MSGGTTVTKLASPTPDSNLKSKKKRRKKKRVILFLNKSWKKSFQKKLFDESTVNSSIGIQFRKMSGKYRENIITVYHSYILVCFLDKKNTYRENKLTSILVRLSNNSKISYRVFFRRPILITSRQYSHILRIAKGLTQASLTARRAGSCSSPGA